MASHLSAAFSGFSHGHTPSRVHRKKSKWKKAVNPTVWFVVAMVIVSYFTPYFLLWHVTTTTSTRPGQEALIIPHSLVLNWTRSMNINPAKSKQMNTLHIGPNEKLTTAHRSQRANEGVVDSSHSCALLFFGLPRSFRLLVLPSIRRNILLPNQKNKCDIFVHYYHLEKEAKGRSGMGGTIDPKEIWLLQGTLDEVYKNADKHYLKPRLSIIQDTKETFSEKRGKLLEKYRTAKGPDGKFLYFPWMAKSYRYPTSMDNIVMQWHSIQSVFEYMEAKQKEWNLRYTRVAMLRNDVVYVTPFDIYQISNMTRDDKNTQVAVPDWARFPINDRMVYGPAQAVKVWATERFERLEHHVRNYEPGYGMHSERFLEHEIFPAIQSLGFEVVANPEICFFRARADGTTWINDCATRNGAALGFRKIDTQKLVEDIVGYGCIKNKFRSKIIELNCNINQTYSNTTAALGTNV